MAHKHHIIPRHAGGSNHPSNLVVLSVEEHALAHKKLFETYGREEDRIAWLGLSGLITGEEAHRLAVSNALKGKPHLHGAKIGAAMRGRSFTEEHKKALRGKRPHVNQTGGNNNAAKKIRTPYGEFDSTQDAARYLGKDRGYVRYRLETHADWNFVGATS
jgi:hypothetical protein